MRTIEGDWGYFAPKYGFELMFNRGGYFDNKCSIDFCFIWGKVNIKLPFKTSLGEGCDLPRYGVQIHDNTFWLHYGGKYDNSIGQVINPSWLTWYIPYFTWVFDKHEAVDKNNEWRVIEKGERSIDIDKWAYFETHPYRYKLSNGEVQDRIAKCKIESRVWHRKWFPFLKQIRKSIDIEFSDEVGDSTGSWKGGVLGCGYDMLKDETIEQCLRRMEIERKFK